MGLVLACHVGHVCQDLAESCVLDMSVGAVVPRFCIPQGSMWVQWVEDKDSVVEMSGIRHK